MTTSILTKEVLAEATGYTRDADIRRCLKANGIHAFDGKNGPWTTTELVNNAGGIVHKQKDEETLL